MAKGSNVASTYALVSLTVQVHVGSWGPDCELRQVYNQSSESAMSRLGKLLGGTGVRIIGDPTVISVTCNQHSKQEDLDTHFSVEGKDSREAISRSDLMDQRNTLLDALETLVKDFSTLMGASSGVYGLVKDLSSSPTQVPWAQLIHDSSLGLPSLARANAIASNTTEQIIANGGSHGKKNPT